MPKGLLRYRNDGNFASPARRELAAKPEDWPWATSGTGDASFTGQNSDTVSSFYDFTFRRFSPSQGRWISPDPAGLAAVDPTNPQTWNRYAYVANNPLSFIDPLGLQVMGPPGTPGNGDPNNQFDPSGDLGPGDGSWGWDSFNGSASPGTYVTVCSSTGCYSYDASTWNALIANGYGPGLWDANGNIMGDVPTDGVEFLGTVDFGLTFFGSGFGPTSTTPTGSIYVTSGVGGSAPSNAPSTPSFWSCTFNGKVGLKAGGWPRSR